jgi:hypothetical protein
MSNLMKICAVGVVPCGQTDAWTDMKLIVDFRNIANTPANWFYCRNIQCILKTIDGVSVAL